VKITALSGLEILDSKGDPTVEVTVTLENGLSAQAAVPSGASTGDSEAIELRDGEPRRYFGKGVQKAVANVNGPLADAVKGLEVFDQENIDQALITADGTPNKARYGGNAVLGISMAVCRAAALAKNMPLYTYFGELTGNTTFTLPQPMILVLEGGKHGNWATEIQEFMVVPRRDAFSSFAEMLRAGAEIFHALEKVLEEKKYSTGVGFEGAFAPQELSSNSEAFQLIAQAVQKSGYKLGSQILLAIDAAASEFYENDAYILKSENNRKLSLEQWRDQCTQWVNQYPLWSIEDPFNQESWEDWAQFKASLPPGVQLVGDDLLTTNLNRIQKGIDMNAVNSVLIKPNQIGTITETLQAIKLAKQTGYTTIISHRGGETNDDLVADLAVGVNAGQCKFGGPDRGERLAKYNRLLRIEQQLGGRLL
jgi:enolase